LKLSDRASLCWLSEGELQATSKRKHGRIRIMPVENLNHDRKQEYLADGVSEDIITELSRFSVLFVIARNSSFKYKGKAVDLRLQVSVSPECLTNSVNVDGSTGWTEKGLRRVKWPKDFAPNERSLIRAIAKTALESSQK